MPPPTHRQLVLVLTTLAILLIPSGAIAASPTDSPAAVGPSLAPQGSASMAANLSGSLLTASDLPAGMTSQGIGDGSQFQIDPQAFADNGGLAVVNQIWQAPTRAPVAMVFDFRFLFPTADAAQAYLTAAEATLSEATASGLSLVQDATPIGDQSVHYAGTGDANGTAVEFQNFLFTVGPVAAKVFVTGFGTTAEDATAIARAAAAHMAAIAGSATGSPAPSVIPSPSVTPTGPGPSPSTTSALPGGEISQWAVSATASSEYSPTDWSAARATGAPDVAAYGNDPAAWGPFNSDGTTEWLELTYGQAVVPTAINIHESYSPGFVTKVEAFDEASSTWATLWEGTDPTPADTFGTFSPPLAKASGPTLKVRITIDTSVPGWNEIDAVELVGVLAPSA